MHNFHVLCIDICKILRYNKIREKFELVNRCKFRGETNVRAKNDNFNCR